MSKSRLTPLKDRTTHTIPRLELMGVLIGCRLLNFIRNALKINITAQYLWTDSQIVLCWLDSVRVLPPFVTARLQEIRKTEKTEFMYVPTKDNPADLATRPCSSLMKEVHWLNGPDFLKENKTKWPTRAKEHILLFNDSATLNAEDLDAIRILQAEHFTEELKKSTDLSKSLGLFLDDGILRCKGRFKNTDWTVGQKYPILLPKNAKFTQQRKSENHTSFHAHRHRLLGPSLRNG